MCRNIRPLFNFKPPATDEEIHAAAIQFVRKISGTRTPSTANAPAYNQAVADIASITGKLIETLTTSAAPKSRELEAAKARQRATRRYPAP